jgi:serine protease Do
MTGAPRRARWAWGMGILAALTMTGGCAASRLTDREAEVQREHVIQRILPSAVQITLEREGKRYRSASGVVVGARPPGALVDDARSSRRAGECFVLTSGHTFAKMAPGSSVSVLFDRYRGAGVKAPATVLVSRDTADLDLALLKIATDDCAAVTLGADPTLGETIWVVAFPWGRNMTLVRGVVSQVDLEASGEGESARLMVDASVSYGSSGGGVYAAQTGELVGLIEGYRTARVPFQVNSQPAHIDVPVPGETYVVSLAQIRRFLGESGYAELLGPARVAVPSSP